MNPENGDAGARTAPASCCFAALRPAQVIESSVCSVSSIVAM